MEENLTDFFEGAIELNSNITEDIFYVLKGKNFVFNHATFVHSVYAEENITGNDIYAVYAIVAGGIVNAKNLNAII